MNKYKNITQKPIKERNYSPFQPLHYLPIT